MDKPKYKIIRGARILQVLDKLEEATLIDLEREIERGFPNTTKRQHATDPVQIPQMKLVASPVSTDLIVKAVASSEGKKYDPIIHFLQVEYEDTDTPNNVTFTAVDGDTYNIAPIKLSTCNVKVRCTCLDFYYRFAVWNDNADSLYGKPPPPYQRKTETRPPANPLQVPGLCKHVIKTTQALLDSGIVVR